MTQPWSDYVDQFGLSMVEARLFAFLADGEPKSTDACLSAGLGKKAACECLVRTHVSRIRKKVEPHGYRILSGRRNGTYRLVAPPPAPLSKRRGEIV